MNTISFLQKNSDKNIQAIILNNDLDYQQQQELYGHLSELGIDENDYMLIKPQELAAVDARVGNALNDSVKNSKFLIVADERTLYDIKNKIEESININSNIRAMFSNTKVNVFEHTKATGPLMYITENQEAYAINKQQLNTLRANLSEKGSLSKIERLSLVEIKALDEYLSNKGYERIIDENGSVYIPERDKNNHDRLRECLEYVQRFATRLPEIGKTYAYAINPNTGSKDRLEIGDGPFIRMKYNDKQALRNNISSIFKNRENEREQQELQRRIQAYTARYMEEERERALQREEEEKNRMIFMAAAYVSMAQISEAYQQLGLRAISDDGGLTAITERAAGESEIEREERYRAERKDRTGTGLDIDGDGLRDDRENRYGYDMSDADVRGLY